MQSSPATSTRRPPRTIRRRNRVAAFTGGAGVSPTRRRRARRSFTRATARRTLYRLELAAAFSPDGSQLAIPRARVAAGASPSWTRATARTQSSGLTYRQRVPGTELGRLERPALLPRPRRPHHGVSPREATGSHSFLSSPRASDRVRGRLNLRLGSRQAGRDAASRRRRVDGHQRA
jgi:hypothetical protein